MRWKFSGLFNITFSQLKRVKSCESCNLYITQGFFFEWNNDRAFFFLETSQTASSCLFFIQFVVKMSMVLRVESSAHCRRPKLDQFTLYRKDIKTPLRLKIEIGIYGPSDAGKRSFPAICYAKLFCELRTHNKAWQIHYWCFLYNSIKDIFLLNNVQHFFTRV